ncbi:hypothetical protein [Streptomyces malaysiensis]|uniref:hypothetical protein n=1 Tax=Streptomyces malaysiensis TaxID=92644 RepID=UPI0036801A85
MTETRKSYKRDITADRSVAVEVVYDDQDDSTTYVSVTDDSGQHEVLLAPVDLAALLNMLHEAQAAKYPKYLSF